jgi:hypothetical protein
MLNPSSLWESNVDTNAVSSHGSLFRNSIPLPILAASSPNLVEDQEAHVTLSLLSILDRVVLKVMKVVEEFQ